MCDRKSHCTRSQPPPPTLSISSLARLSRTEAISRNEESLRSLFIDTRLSKKKPGRSQFETAFKRCLEFEPDRSRKQNPHPCWGPPSLVRGTGPTHVAARVYCLILGNKFILEPDTPPDRRS